MDDVDSINLSILRGLGCNFPVDIVTISQFQSEHIVLSCAVALRAIDENLKLPKKLPDGKASRFRICTDMSTAIQVCHENLLYKNMTVSSDVPIIS